jgi:hypothetical protein
MAGLRTVAVQNVATAGTRQPVFTGSTATITNVALQNNLLTVTCSNSFVPGQQVGFWGVATATFLNNVRVVVQSVTSTQFTAVFVRANYNSASDSGTAFTSPIERFRIVRIEVDQSAGAGKIFVGDLNVSSTQYVACLTLTGQIAFEFTGEDIDPSTMFVDTSVNGTKWQTGLVQ